MDPDFWRVRWEEGRLGWHQERVNERLVRRWPDLAADAGAPVLVPLCGKSLDMGWLRASGHPVIGVELSEVAAGSFFEERGETPEVSRDARFTRFAADGITILAGDFFALERGDLAGARYVYDRAALIALDPDERRAYGRHLAALLPPGARGLLITIEFDPEKLAGPPFTVGDDEVSELLGHDFELRLLEEDAGPEVAGKLRDRGVDSLREAVFALERRGGA